MSLRESLAVTGVSDTVFEAAPDGDGLLYGGLTLGVALSAASRTVPATMEPKSLHAYFLRPGQWRGPTELTTTPTSDGRTVANRQVTATQNGKLVATAAVSFHVPGAGADWPAAEPPAIALPEQRPAIRIDGPISRCIEVRPVDPEPAAGVHSPHPFWSRPIGAVGETPAGHHAAIAFTSDYLVILSVAPFLSARTDPLAVRTLDHSIWFHRTPLTDDWLLYTTEAVTVSGGRGFVHGAVRARDGALIASFSQEVFIPG